MANSKYPWLFSLFVILLLALCGLNAQTNPNHVHVKGYYRSDGTYVSPHFRTAPNSTNRDNFSTIGNINPYTGKPGSIQPDNKPMPTYNYSSTYHGTTNFNYSGASSSDKKRNHSYNDEVSWAFDRIEEMQRTYYTSSALNLRSGRSSNSRVLTVIPEGAKVDASYDFFNKWWKVSYDGYVGYASSNYLTKTNGSIDRYSSLSNYSSYSNTSYGTYHLTQKTSLRTGPGSEYAVILRFDTGDRVSVIDNSGKWWWKVLYNGNTGWVKCRLLR